MAKTHVDWFCFIFAAEVKFKMYHHYLVSKGVINVDFEKYDMHTVQEKNYLESSF